MTRKNMFAIFFVIIACFGITATAASAQQSGSVCTDGTCQVIPATVNQTIEQLTTTSTTERTIASKSIKSKIRHYEQTKNVVVAVHMNPQGVKSMKGCYDPVKKGWIKDGGVFRNTRKNGSPFWDKWKRKDARTGKIIMICNPKLIKVGNRSYMQGTKSNCKNTKIRIQVKGPRTKHKVKQVEEFKSYKEFEKVYNKWTTKTTVVTTTPNVKVTYSCPAGWTLEGTSCRKCEQPTCVKDGAPALPTPAEAPAPNPQPSPEEPFPGGYACYDETTGAPVVPIIVNGVTLCPSGSWGKPV